MIKDMLVQIAMKELRRLDIIDVFEDLHYGFEKSAMKCQSCFLSDLTKVSKQAKDEVKSLKRSRKMRRVSMKNLKGIQQELQNLEGHIVTYVKPGIFGSNFTCPA